MVSSLPAITTCGDPRKPNPIIENPKIVKDYQNNPKAIEALIGKVMQKTKGQADPKITRGLILEIMNEIDLIK